MADVFLSYASEDRERIEPLVKRLEAEGWSVWWDRALIVGPSFEEKIEEALADACCVVVAWSEHSVRSRWCRAEAAEGIERNILVPVLIDDVRPPLQFRGSHTASLLGWPDGEHDLSPLLSGITAYTDVALRTPTTAQSVANAESSQRPSGKSRRSRTVAAMVILIAVTTAAAWLWVIFANST